MADDHFFTFVIVRIDTTSCTLQTQVATLALAQWKLNIMKVQGITKICSL